MSSKTGIRRCALPAAVRPTIARHRSFVWCIVIAAIGIPASTLHGQVLTDGSFEAFAVSSGGFVKPMTGPWTFINDAGVVEPFAPNSSTGPLNTWSATFAAQDGQQYASTYAGADSISQLVSFSAAGVYRLSAYAAAPTGSVTIPPVPTQDLTTGEFTFTLDDAPIGGAHTMPVGTNWTLFSADFTLFAPGDHRLGIRNTIVAPYFINYDALAIAAVPEPSTYALFLVSALVLLIVKRNKPARPRQTESRGDSRLQRPCGC